MTLRVSKGQEIAGYDARDVRRLFRKIYGSEAGFSCVFVARILHITSTEAKTLAADLTTLEYFEKAAKYALDKENFYRLTEKGREFARASGAPRIPRSRAEEIVKELMSRVSTINADSRYAYRISVVVIFGSYLTNKPNLGDVDTAIELTGRTADEEELRKWEERRRALARRSGRRFSNVVEELGWAQTEIRLFLKNRTRGLNLHYFDELAAMAKQRRLSYRVLLGDRTKIDALLSTPTEK